MSCASAASRVSRSPRFLSCYGACFSIATIGFGASVQHGAAPTSRLRHGLRRACGHHGARRLRDLKGAVPGVHWVACLPLVSAPIATVFLFPCSTRGRCGPDQARSGSPRRTHRARGQSPLTDTRTPSVKGETEEFIHQHRALPCRPHAGSGPSLFSSEVCASKLKPQAINAFKCASSASRAAAVRTARLTVANLGPMKMPARLSACPSINRPSAAIEVPGQPEI